jgi:hypothetical protein
MLAMNDRAARLVSAITNAPTALRALLSDWDEIDEEMREHYSEDTRWLLSSAQRLVRSQDSLAFTVDQLLEIDRAAVELAAMCDNIERCMGFRPDAILPPACVATTAARRSCCRR